jgi:hypothetical protein
MLGVSASKRCFRTKNLVYGWQNCRLAYALQFRHRYAGIPGFRTALRRILRCRQLDQIGPLPVHRAEAEVFRLNVAGVPGWVVAGIEVAYGAEQHVLVRYGGVSDMRDAAGENSQVYIDFHSKDRSSSNERAVAAAKQMPLAPCKV